MKKRRIMLAVVMALMVVGFCGCGSESAKEDAKEETSETNETDEESFDREDPDSGEEEGDEIKSSETDMKYKTFDDISESIKFNLKDIYINYPNSWAGGNEISGYWLSNGNLYTYDVLIATDTIDEEENHEESIDALMEDEAFPEFLELAGEVAGWTWEDPVDLATLNPQKTTVLCGAEAIEFEGTLPPPSKHATGLYEVYGCSFVFEGTTVTVGYIILEEPDGQVAEEGDPKYLSREELKDYVDRIIQTIRTEE